MNLRNVWLITKNTFRGTVTGRWLILFAIVFFLLVVNIPLLYLLESSELQTSYLDRWVPYLISLAYPSVPLLSLPVGAPMIVEERELGILQFTLSNPVSKSEYLSGKILGLLLATTLVIFAAFLFSAVTAYGAELSRYGNIMLIVLAGGALNFIMVGVAMVISLLTRRKATALGLGLFAWFIFTTISDLGVLSIVINSSASPLVAVAIVLLNPVEVGSILAGSLTGTNISSMSATTNIVARAFHTGANGILTLDIVLYMAFMFVLCYIIFLKQDI